MSITDNHGEYNKFQVMTGVRLTGKASACAYILECKLKKAIRKASPELLSELSLLKYGRKKVISAFDLERRIEPYGLNALQECISMLETEGLKDCLILILKIKGK